MNGQTPSQPSANIIQWHKENPDIQAIITSINNHHLSILEGRYDTQRSSCAYQVAIELIAQHQTVVLFTFWRSAEEVGIQLTSQLAQLNPEILKQGQLTEQNWAQLTQAIEQVNQAELLICDECPMTTAMLRERVQHISNQRPIQFIIIDYLHLQMHTKFSNWRCNIQLNDQLATDCNVLQTHQQIVDFDDFQIERVSLGKIRLINLLSSSINSVIV